MKKAILSITALFAFCIVSAQEEAGGKGFAKNDVLLSGSVGFSSQKTGDAKTNMFNVIPRVGYFVSDNLALGVQLGYTGGKNSYFDGTEDVESKLSSFSAGAFARYYFTPGNDFSFFGQAGASYYTSKSEVENSESKVNGFDIGVSPGINYFVSNHISLEATFGFLGYSTRKPDADGADSTDTFNLNLDLTNISLGILYKF